MDKTNSVRPEVVDGGSVQSNEHSAYSGHSARDSIEYVIHDPISSGFLFAYCEAHYCSENIRFVMEIDKFRDYFSLDVAVFGTQTYRQIDRTVGLAVGELVSSDEMEREFESSLNSGSVIPATSWPSKKVDRFAVLQMIKMIWDTFLAKNSPSWICIPSRTLYNTIQRIKMLHIYGREAFSEALIDPIKTLHRDIYPRFLHSEHHAQLVRHASNINEKVAASSLRLPSPNHTALLKYSVDDLERGDIRFTLRDLVEDRVLYNEFMKYLVVIVSAENLKCVRSINIFKEKFASADPRDRAAAVEQVWTTYKYFVAVNAPYEVSMSHLRRKELMRELANPNLNTFHRVEKSALSALKVHFHTFAATKEYANLASVVLARSRHSNRGASRRNGGLNGADSGYGYGDEGGAGEVGGWRMSGCFGL